MGVNDDIGSFEFYLPSQIGLNYFYNDLAVGDRIKLWLGWDNDYATGNPDFMGKIYQIISQGKFKLIRGKSNSEILARRIKARTVWTAVEADDIVATVASDLSLGSDLAVDTTAVTLTEDSETYTDIMRKVSDYWYNAGTQIKKDYYIDTGDAGHPYGHLIWKSRPIRTTGVETLTYGANIKDYIITTDATNIKNAIGAYGALTPFNPKDTEVNGRKNPVNGDDYTYGGTWTALQGTVATNATAPKIGASCTRINNTVAPHHMECKLELSDPVNVEGLSGYSVLEFYSRRWGFNSPINMQLWAPDDSNYFQASFTAAAVDDTWSSIQRFALGKNNEYNATTNPSGQWTAVGSADWNNLQYFYIPEIIGASNQYYIDFDGLCFNFGRWRYIPASDATSITAYDECDNITIDENLNSDAECESRAKTLLYQHKDPVKRLDMTVIGNMNILLGDQIPITLIPENISATNFYVTAVGHEYTMPDTWLTKVTLVDTVSSRNIPAIRHEEALAASIKNLQQISRNVKKVN